MNSDWSLDVLYKGTLDPQLAKDMDTMYEAAETYKQLINFLPCPQEASGEELIKALKDVILAKEAQTLVTRRLSEIKESVSHLIGDEAEGVLAQMNISGGMAWGH